MQPSPAQPSSQQQLSRPPTPDAARTGFAPYASPTPSPRAAPIHASACVAQQAAHAGTRGVGVLSAHRCPCTAAAAGIPACAPEWQQLLSTALALERCVAGSPMLQAALVGLEAAAEHPQVAAGACAAAGVEWSLAQTLALLARAGDEQGASHPAAAGALALMALLRGQVMHPGCRLKAPLPLAPRPHLPVLQSARARC